ncbi:hypothetical protein EG329_001694 [Mollisiaceae sp. DMI_Dod_QoI]|nr:hypothetical protein EG329_001694 [Helotiales sp. DMI_Dod_QoI]
MTTCSVSSSMLDIISASAFCSTYITGTSVSTIIPLITKTVTATTTDGTSFATVIVLATQTSTIPGPDAVITAAPKEKRQALPGCPGKVGTYPPDRISSACSCLVTPAMIISTTTTAAVSTVTIASTLHMTKQATTTETSTTIVVSSLASYLKTYILTRSLQDVTGPPTAIATVVGTPPLASYCTSGVIGADIVVGSVQVDCSLTFVGNSDSYFIGTMASYQACADTCVHDLLCGGFSYLLTATTNNCYLFQSIGLGSPDPTVDSGTSLGSL